MDLDTSFISRIDFLVPSTRLNAAFSAFFVALHSVVLYFLVSSLGEAYRLVIEELTAGASMRGEVLTPEMIKSTEEQPIPGEFSPSPMSVIAIIVSVSMHLVFVLSQKWSVDLRVFFQFRRVGSVKDRPSHVCVFPPEFRGKPEILPLSACGDDGRYMFSFQRRKFELLTASETPSSTRVRLLSFPLDRRIADFVSANRKGLASELEVKKRQELYGLNAVEIPVPAFWKLYLDQLLSPIPIFQLFCSALWMMDEYWKYTLFTLFSIFGFEVSTTVQRKKSLETLKSMSVKSVVSVQVKRMNVWNSVLSDQLVPGDLIRLSPPQGTAAASLVVPCDCLIVSGSAVVNEASLTGESIPQMKDAIDADRLEVLDAISGSDKVHCLFSGTNLIRVDADIELIVIRTGSQSSQGELLRMVEYSQQDVFGSNDKRDTMYLLFLLLIFALIAAGYVVYERVSGEGSENLTRMKSHKLMLRVIMIITSVVPPELPIQLSLSVNTALIALNKIGIYCTEPFRVPMAGTITHCFFDKTGTLTSDQLKCISFDPVVEGEVDEKFFMSKVELVVAGCHSLIASDNLVIGDPIELTALDKIGYKFNHSKNTSVSPDGGKRWVKILHRFHFSSALQRMSCVVQDDEKNFHAVVKGSPEIILTKLKDQPEEKYMQKYESLAKQGRRVLALAYKPLGSGAVNYHRDEIEQDLVFAGFASFACETRSDSRAVISALKHAGGANLPCIMVTGDAALTSVHVGKQTGMIEKDSLRLVKNRWVSLDGAALVDQDVVFEKDQVPELAKKYSLVLTGDEIPTDESHEIWTHVIPFVTIFARMSPQQKERVIATVRAAGGKPLMCGDGGNDVGALKQADVGVALLAGFGSVNTAKTCRQDEEEFEIEENVRITQLKEKYLNMEMKKEFEARKKVLMAKQQALLQIELGKPNNGGYWACIKKVTGDMRSELSEESKKLQAKYGVEAVYDDSQGSKSGSGSSSSVVQMGDASVAAPFTSRAPSIRSVVQIIKQGRCTLLVSVQMMQIMMLESLISAYTFAAITMEGGRSTEIQMIGSSIFVMIASVAFTYAKPAKKLSSVIPLRSVFSPAIFISVISQVLLHIAVLVYAMRWAKTEMGESALSDLYKFERSREEKLSSLMEAANDSSSSSWIPTDMWSMFKSVPYQANLLNTVMFLVKTSQQVSVLVVNYKGSPWMQGALENKALFLSMFACALGIIICSSGYIPLLNDTLELLVLPPDLRSKLLLLLAASSIGAFLIDRFVVLLFAPTIFRASTLDPLFATKLTDFVPLLKTCGYISVAVLVSPVLLGNPIGIIGAIYLFRKYRQWQADQEQAELREKFPALFNR